MGMKLVHLILILLMLTSNGLSFGRKRINKRQGNLQNSCETIVYNPLTDPNATVVDHHCDCGSAEFGVVQKIPYLRACSECDSIEINFSSTCVRCGMCLAISEKINQTLLGVHNMMASNTWLNDTEIILLLRTICDHSFKHHGLQEMNGKRLISDRIPGSTFVTTSADGLWGKKLRDLCHYYLDEIREVQLYEYWRRWCKDEEESHDLATILCRSANGVLRDCRNVEDLDEHETSFKTYAAKMKITATYD